MSRRALGWVVCGLLVGIGLWLRLRDVSTQVLAGDEYHSVRVAWSHSLFELFTYYDPAENCIPLSMYARALVDTVGLTELRFRLPAIVAGAALILAPLAFRELLGRGAVLIAIALIATSPTLVYYSFVGRPYGPSAAWLLAALYAWTRWVRSATAQVAPERAAMGAFVLCAALAVFFHLLSLFPVGWLVLASWLAVRRGQLPRRSATVMTLALLLLGLALLGPGLPGLLEHRLVGSKRPGVGTPALAWYGYLKIAGEHPSTALTLLLLALLGSVHLVRRHGLVGWAFVGLLPAVLVGMFATQAFPTRPAWMRYLSLGWPAFLMVAAVGAAALTDACVRGARASKTFALALLGFAAAAVALRWGVPLGEESPAQAALPWMLAALFASAALAGLLVSGQEPGPGGTSGGALAACVCALLWAVGTVAWTAVPLFRSGPDDLRTRRRSVRLEPQERVERMQRLVPPFVSGIADDPEGGEVVLVWPFRVNVSLWEPFVVHQRAHRKRVVFVHERPQASLQVGTSFSNAIDADRMGELALRGARYLIVYLHFVERPAEAQGSARRAATTPLVAERYFAVFREGLERDYGQPVYVDARIEVFDLRRGVAR